MENPTQYHATVLMKGRGPFVRSIEHIQDIRELHTFKIENMHVFMYSGRMWVQKARRWILVMGVTILPSILVESSPGIFAYEQATWVGTWQ